MKPITKQLSSLLTTICSFFLSILGFGCSSPEDVPDMYGMPVSNFEVKGRVTDETKTPVKGAEIKLMEPQCPSNGYNGPSTTTSNINGFYSIRSHGYLPEYKVVCVPKENNLQSDSVIISYEKLTDDVNFVLKSKD